MNIIKAREEDIAGIARVQVETWKKTYKGIISEDFLKSMAYEKAEEHLARIFKEGNSKCLVAKDKAEKIFWFAVYGPERTKKSEYNGELYAIYILHEHQRKGIGKELTKAVAQDLKEMGISSLLVWVIEINPSRNFYERLGGKHISKKKIQIGNQLIDEISYGWEDTEIILK